MNEFICIELLKSEPIAIGHSTQHDDSTTELWSPLFSMAFTMPWQPFLRPANRECYAKLVTGWHTNMLIGDVRVVLKCTATSEKSHFKDVYYLTIWQQILFKLMFILKKDIGTRWQSIIRLMTSWIKSSQQNKNLIRFSRKDKTAFLTFLPSFTYLPIKTKCSPFCLLCCMHINRQMWQAGKNTFLASNTYKEVDDDFMIL